MSSLSKAFTLMKSVFSTYSQLSKYGVGYFNYWKFGAPEKTWLYQFLRRPKLQSLTERRRIAISSVFGNKQAHKLISADFHLFITGENIAQHQAYHDHALSWADLSLGFDHVSHEK